MKISVGLKSHSGWAVLVALGVDDDGVCVVERRRLELVEPGAAWAKQPYHAAEGLPSEEARRLVEKGKEAAKRVAAGEMKSFVQRSKRNGHEILGCAVLVGTPMPEWTTEQILAVHLRMHKAEGMLFPEALLHAAAKCGLNARAIAEKELGAHVEESIGLSAAMKKVSELGESVGPPWGKDQKNATLAAMIILEDVLPNKPPATPDA